MNIVNKTPPLLPTVCFAVVRFTHAHGLVDRPHFSPSPPSVTYVLTTSSDDPRIFFVTNNSTKSRKGYKKKFDSLGLVR